MGTDIHMWVEKKNAQGAWEGIEALPPRCCSWCDGRGKYEPRLDRDGKMIEPVCYSCKGSGKDTEAYHDRNYHLFAILANVRNGVGFAGCDLGDGFVPICEPRGLPDDVSALGKREMEGWSGYNDASWHTLRTLLDVDYKQTTNLRGVVSAAEYVRWTTDNGGKGAPKHYCGAISGRTVRTITQGEMKERINKPERTDGMLGPPQKIYARPLAGDEDGVMPEADGYQYYTQVQWQETYREAVGENWFQFLETLQALGAPDDIRICFFFDS